MDRQAIKKYFVKIVILSNLFPPNSRGGAEEAAKNQALEFLRQGNEVVVITLSPPSVIPAKAGIQKDGFKIYFLPHKNIFNYFNIGKHSAPARFAWHIIDTFNCCLARDIKKILQKEKPDLVVCHNMKGLSFFTLFVIRNSSFVIHQVVHDVSLYTPSGLIVYGKEDIFEHQGFFTRIYRFFTRRLFKYAEKVFFPSAWLLNFYRKNGFFINQEKIHQPNEVGFFNCHCEERTRDAATSPTIRSPRPDYRARDDGHRDGFLYVGQLEPHKGAMLLLDAFHGFGDVNLDIVGDGGLMPEIKKRAELNPNIIIHGRMPREKLPEFYSRAKAVIVPSLVYENAPMVIGEALSCGAKVIVSRLGGAPEQIKEGINGYTFNPGDAKDLAEKMKKYIASNNLTI
ncbi:MAG: glycosyltransferase [bacterium]